MSGRKAQRQPKARRARRASQRVIVSIDLAARPLRNLMTEQCRDNSGYITVYQASRAELIAAGVPEEILTGGGISEFQVWTLNACCTGSHELLSGSTRATAAGYELEIDWGFICPYVQGSHPAVGELARMLLKDVLAWTGENFDDPDLAHPIDMLAADPRSDYKSLPGAQRLKVTAEFHKKLGDYASKLYSAVYSDCEVLPDMAPAREQRPKLRLVGDMEVQS